MLVSFNPISQNKNINKCEYTSKYYKRQMPLQADSLTFTSNLKKDLLALPAKKIIEVCENSLREGIRLGEGKEAIAYKIEQFPDYCIRQEKRYNKESEGYKLSRNLNKYDVVNHVVARLDEGTTILKYIPGMPIKITSCVDSKRPIKETIQGLVANEFPERAFKKVLKQVEDAKCNDIDFDRFGENLHVDPLNQEMVCIDFSPYIRDESGEYNPITYIYTALDVDNTQHAERVFGKLCNAYAQRLVETPINRLNFDKLDINFYHRGFESDGFNMFPDRELLAETQSRLERLISAKKNKIPSKELQEQVNDFKNFVNQYLMPIKDYSYNYNQVYY